MPDDRILAFADSMIAGNIIEALRMCIFRFDVDDRITTKKFLCYDQIDDKGNPKYAGVAVFSRMV